MKNDRQIFRYLKFKRRFVQGMRLCKNLGIRLDRLPLLNEVKGVGSFGICTSKSLTPIRYAKANGFCADFIAFFSHNGKYLCRKDRPLRRGKLPPNAMRKHRNSVERGGE